MLFPKALLLVFELDEMAAAVSMRSIQTVNLHRSCVLTGGLCFMDWAPPNRHQTLHFGPKRNHAILMDSWFTGGTKKINHKATRQCKFEAP